MPHAIVDYIKYAARIFHFTPLATLTEALLLIFYHDFWLVFSTLSNRWAMDFRLQRIS